MPSVVCLGFDQVASTSDEAKRRGAEYSGQAVLIHATTQTQARGSHGRSWVSPPGGAWFSLAVPLKQPEAATPLVVGEALLEVLSGYADGLTLKHPNDLLHRGRKLAGILCEQTLTPGRNDTTAIIGVGINANFPAARLGDGLRTPPTSLRDILGQDVALAELIAASAAAILRWLPR